jgi:putative ABC transport system permease protein
MHDWRTQIRDAIACLNLDPSRAESIVEELAEHLDARFNECLANGIGEQEADRIVMAELSEENLQCGLRPLFGPAPSPFVPGRDDRGSFFASIRRDLEMALRLLRLNPGFAMVAILSLALGIGANAAIFELIDAVVLRALPVPDPQTLANIQLIHTGRVGSTVARQHEISSAIWDQLSQKQQAFSPIAAWSTERFDLGEGGEARYADGMWVSGSFFDTLEVRPSLGRLFSPSDDYKGCGIQGVVISYGFWKDQFGARSNAVGSTLSLSRHAFQIIGVTPPGFTGLEVGRKFDVALPLCSEPAVHADGAWSSSPTTWWLAAIGRMRPGWGIGYASAQLDSISPGIFAATLPPVYDAIVRENYLRFRLHAAPAATGDSPLRREYAYPLYLLLGISGMVLLIACANIANLLLAKASVRRQEMALRLALGASRFRLIRQLLSESLLLAGLGTALGATLAYGLSRALIAAISRRGDQVFLSLSPDWRVLSFTAGTGLLTCLVFGLAPALHAANTDAGSVAKTGGKGLGATHYQSFLRRGFMVSQIAFSLLLVIAAFLFVRTFQNLAGVDLGFRQDHVLVADFDATPLRLPVERRSEFARDLLARVQAAPGVLSAAETAIVPLSGNGWNDFIDIPGTATQRKSVNFSEVSPDYFRTLAIPIFAGRDFDQTDTLNAPPVAIVNRAFAQTYLGEADPVGGVFGVRQDSGMPDKLYRIVGVSANTKYTDAREEYGPIVFLPESQDPAPDPDATILIRSREETGSLIASLKALAARLSPSVVLNFSVLRDSIVDRLGRERMMALLSGFYGLLAVVLSVIGLCGLLSYAVAQRTKEIGIRMALGATRNRILLMILREALQLLIVGLVFGIVLVLAAGRSVQAILYGVKATDPSTLGFSIAGMTLLALAASLLPALRAATVQPVETLREE